jgi:hypothetical protein
LMGKSAIPDITQLNACPILRRSPGVRALSKPKRCRKPDRRKSRSSIEVANYPGLPIIAVSSFVQTTGA